jgi:hypothetical protein
MSLDKNFIKDDTLSCGFNGFVRISSEFDGGFLCGGDFTQHTRGVDTTSANRICKINEDGSLDSGFSYGIGFNGAVRAMCVSGDYAYLGGFFSTYKGVTASKIIRIDSSGANVASFNTGDGFDDVVYDIKQFTSTVIVAVGNFDNYKGVSNPGVIMIRPDGSENTPFDTGLGLTGPDKAYCVLVDGSQILVGGGFTSYDGNTSNTIVRINSDGSYDSTFDPSAGANGLVYNIIKDGDGYIVVGDFSEFDGVERNGTARLNNDGSLDTFATFPFNSSAEISSIYKYPNGKYIISGIFTSFNGISRNRMLRLNGDYTLDTIFNLEPGFNNDTRFIPIGINKILAYGNFTTFKGDTQTRIVLLKRDAVKYASESFKFNVSCDCEKFTPYRFVWRNRRGGFDTYTFRLRDKKVVNIQKKGYQQFLNSLQNDSRWTYKFGDRGKTEYWSSAYEEVNVFSTYLTEFEGRWLEEIYTSVEVYLLTYENGEYRYNPIVITSNSVEIRDKKGYSNRLISHNITFIYSYNKIINT